MLLLPLLFVYLFVLSSPAEYQGFQSQPHLIPSHCDGKCGKIQVPFPFYLNASCGLVSKSFHLSCFNSTTLFLNISSESYKVLEFYSDGVLVDFPGPSSCRRYNDLNSFKFSGNGLFGISIDNVIGLYDCDDSSLCKAVCEKTNFLGCDGISRDSPPACCYPLNDYSVWHVGDDFSVFSKSGCRGFSSWFVHTGSNTGKRGVKLEWAVPRNFSGICAENSFIANATTVEDAVRCVCSEGYVGDGFANGLGCLKSCVKDGKDAYGNDCLLKGHHEKELVILTGVLAPVFIIASLIGLFCILKRPIKQNTNDSYCTEFPSSVLLHRKACRTRLFTHRELEEATEGFGDDGNLVEGVNGVIFTGVLRDGSRVGVHRLQCANEGDLKNMLSQIEILHTVAHKNIALILGCCIDSGYAPLVVYEHPPNGTLEKHLHHHKGKGVNLDWCKRLKIAAETASVLAFLQYEVSPPIFHHHLKSSHIFLDADFSVKISGFGLLSVIPEENSHLIEASSFHNNDVYDFGIVLLEIVTGLNNSDLPMVALQKIRSGMLEEVVDPLLYYHELPPHIREEIERVADLATRCLLFGGDGKLKMIDVSKELTHVRKDGVDRVRTRGTGIEETFSNSSLLQMISMSPDSILAT